MTTHILTEDDQQPLIALLNINNDHSYSYIRTTTTTESYRGPPTTTHSLKEGHHKPLIAFRGSSTITHCLTEDHQRSIIALQRAINDHS